MEVNVLMIDDHELIIEGYKSILSYNKNGYLPQVTSANTAELAYNIISNPENRIDFEMVFIDINLPPFPEKNLHTGEDIAKMVRHFLPKAKIIIATSYMESFILNRILKDCNPEGLIVKSDITALDFQNLFHIIIQGERYYSTSVMKHKQELIDNSKVLDFNNRQIIILLSRGIKTKNLHEHMFLSISAIEKRKVIIKEFFGVEKGTDEDILREARKQGLI
jgi:two-component system, NarL family, response regulator NreC